MIIGITGTIGAGKGTFAKIAVEMGFLHLSVRQCLLEEIDRRGMPRNRDSMKIVADDLRKRHGPAYNLEVLYRKAVSSGKDAVLESIRNSREILRLRELGPVVIVSVIADRKIRYERVKKRANESDHISYETFIEHEEREMHGKQEYEMDIANCLQMADYTLDNSGTYDGFREKVMELLKKIRE